MAQPFSDLLQEDEVRLRDGLEVLERVIDSDTLMNLDLWIYGMVSNPNVLSIAKEAIIADDEESMNESGDSSLEVQDVNLTEIAVGVPISSDILLLLEGKGYPLNEIDVVFAYQTETEGPVTGRFTQAYRVTGNDRVRMDDLKSPVIANSESYIDEYLKTKGQAKLKINREVRRDEEATQHEHPEGTEPKLPAKSNPVPPSNQTAPPPPQEGQSPQQGLPKQTSWKISHIVEEFLG